MVGTRLIVASLAAACRLLPAPYCLHPAPTVPPTTVSPAAAQIFSLSKLSGHAGSRLGWALIRKTHTALYDAAAQFMQDISLGISADTQARDKLCDTYRYTVTPTVAHAIAPIATSAVVPTLTLRDALVPSRRRAGSSCSATWPTRGTTSSTRRGRAWRAGGRRSARRPGAAARRCACSTSRPRVRTPEIERD